MASDDKIRHPKILLAFRLLFLKDDSYVLHRGSPRPLAPAPRTRPALHLGAGGAGGERCIHHIYRKCTRHEPGVQCALGVRHTPTWRKLATPTRAYTRH